MNEPSYATLKQKSKHLDIVNELALDLLRTSDLDNILWIIAKTAIAKLGFEDCVVYLLDKDNSTLVQRAAHGPKNPFATDILNPITIAVGEGIVGQVAQTGVPEIVACTRDDARYIVDDEMRLSEMSVPIFYAGNVIGVIDSEHPQANFYTQEHLEVVTTIASMAATKIANAINNEQLEVLTRQLHYDASHDDLTGLLNRRAFERILDDCLENLDPEVDTHVLCYLDVNGFKQLNDTFGHAAGDEYLRKIATIFRSALDDNHISARIGGDEFGILFKNVGIAESRKICAEISDQIERTCLTKKPDDGFAHLSMGLYLLEQSGLSLSDAMAHADAACYTAKRNPESPVCDYSEIRDYIAAEKMELSFVSWLRSAMDANDLQLVAQEIFPAGGSDNRHCFEVLLRLGDDVPEDRPISNVLQIVERHGLGTRLDCWVVTQTLDWMCSQRELVEQRIAFIAINLSSESIKNASFQQFLIESINKSRLPAHRLCFEITENVANQDLQITAVLIGKLRAIGCLIALDDFGSSMASYDYLRYLSADILKIDGKFVRNAVADTNEAVMMSSINDLAHALGMRTVAEHVEDSATFKLVNETGIDFIQGYYLGKPVGIEHLPQLIKTEPAG